MSELQQNDALPREFPRTTAIPNPCGQAAVPGLQPFIGTRRSRLDQSHTVAEFSGRKLPKNVQFGILKGTAEQAFSQNPALSAENPGGQPTHNPISGLIAGANGEP